MKTGTRIHLDWEESAARRQRGTSTLQSRRYWLHIITTAMVLETPVGEVIVIWSSLSCEQYATTLNMLVYARLAQGQLM